MQGDWWNIPPDERDRGYDKLPPWSDASFSRVNFARRALRVADVVNTVSETYARELLTNDFGQGQERLLQHRAQTGRLFGIVNGLDYDDFNPSLDPGLVANYDYDSLANKTKNKLALQAAVGLPVDPKVPLVATASRITEQKGFDLVLEVLEPLLRLDLQLVIWGSGDRRYETAIRRAMRRHPRRVKANLEFDTEHVTRIYAGADIFLMPSRFEPCGLGQLESLRYGAIPVVHATGGLADTISDYSARSSTGNGFVFHTYDHRDLLAAVARAVEAHRHRDDWLTLVRHAMRQSFNWVLPARKYVRLFRRATHVHQRLYGGEAVVG
jgi:starch synthase